MNFRTSIGVFIILVTAASTALSARKSDAEAFVWDSITDKDWIPVNDTLVTAHGATMLFERVLVDDASKDDPTFLTTYCRIRIGSSEGRSAADVIVPYYYEDQKVRQILGRTVRHNSDTVMLAPEQILEKEVLRTQGTKIKQVSFSLPGVSEDCIIEYVIKLKLPSTYKLWLIQKDLPMMYGELRWKLPGLGGKSFFDFGFFRISLAPNWVWMNMPRKVKIQRLPSLKDTKEVIFTVDSVPAFEHEVHALPDNALKGQARLYYGSGDTPGAYWGSMASHIPSTLEEFVGKSDRIKKVAAGFDSAASDGDKIQQAYRWVRNTFKNVSFLKASDTANLKLKYETVAQAFRSGHADSRAINYMFCDLLRELNIDAKIVWVGDRDEDLFVPEVKIWQFDRTLVGVPDTASVYSFYCPGNIFASPGQIPWFNEGITGLVGTTEGNALVIVPFSDPSRNRTNRLIQLGLTGELELLGKVGERRTGQAARDIRVELHDLSDAEKPDKVKKSLAELLPQAEIDSVRCDNVDTVDLPINLAYTVKYPAVTSGLAGDRLLLKPIELLEKAENPFVAETRQNTIVMKYAFERDEALTLDLPEGWTLEGLPPDTMFTNTIGSCGVRFDNIGNSVSAQRVFKINLPFVSVEDYPEAQRLYRALVGLNGLTVTLRSPTK